MQSPIGSHFSFIGSINRKSSAFLQDMNNLAAYDFFLFWGAPEVEQELPREGTASYPKNKYRLRGVWDPRIS